MAGQHFKLRAHHLVNLVVGHRDGYQSLRDGLSRTVAVVEGERRRLYTDRDGEVSQEIYSEIARDPDNTVELVGGIDPRCRVCSNYDRGTDQCNTFPEVKLGFEDQRSLDDLFPDLQVGDVVRVGDVLKEAEMIIAASRNSPIEYF